MLNCCTYLESALFFNPGVRPSIKRVAGGTEVIDGFMKENSVSARVLPVGSNFKTSENGCQPNAAQQRLNKQLNEKMGTEYNFRRFNPGGLVFLLFTSLLWAGLLMPLASHGAARMQVTPDGGYGTPITPPAALPDIELTDEQGQPMQLADLEGHPTLLFFGFTHCPHICPTTLSMLRGIRERLPPAVAEQLQVWLISVDPMRDTPEQLKTYLTNFGAGFHGATADLGLLVPLFKQLGIGYSYEVDEQGGGYDVGHTTTIFLLNDQARLSRVYTAPHDATALLGSLSTVLK